MNDSNGFFTESVEKARKWSIEHDFQLALFNISIVLLVLLRSAGYFEPFFPITINLIVLTAFVLSIILLNAKSNFLFILSLTFWVFAGFLKVVGIDVWSERTVVYAFESFSVGMILLIIETSNLKEIDLKNLIHSWKDNFKR